MDQTSSRIVGQAFTTCMVVEAPGMIVEVRGLHIVVVVVVAIVVADLTEDNVNKKGVEHQINL